MKKLFEENPGTHSERRGRNPFHRADFTDIADAETVRRNLNRLTHAGVLRRLLQGVFEKPRFNTFLGEYIAIHPDAVARTSRATTIGALPPVGILLLMHWAFLRRFRPYGLIAATALQGVLFRQHDIQFKHRTKRKLQAFRV
jgi:hypothetical protein